METINPKSDRGTGIIAALASATFLGFTPIFGKQAIIAGFSPLTTVALRTSAAGGYVWLRDGRIY
jgi:uncharacterized membrane protein